MAKEKVKTAEAIDQRKRVNGQALAQIDALREKRGLSINKMAEAAGVSPQAWYQWQNGDASPTIEFLDRIAVGLKGRLLVQVYEAGQPPVTGVASPPQGEATVDENDDTTKRILGLLSKVSPEIRHRIAVAMENWILEELGIRNPLRPVRTEGAGPRAST